MGGSGLLERGREKEVLEEYHHVPNGSQKLERFASVRGESVWVDLHV